ncbi:MAG: 6,7-dimethyl-8-ribityllumazine synthase [Gemmatimonadota bacterium]
MVVARFNHEITESLLRNAIETLVERGAAPSDLEVVRVPGAWELPSATRRVVDRGGVDAVIALGCVIRGETPHFEFVAGEASRGLGDLSRTAPVPIVFGLLTTDDLAQARARAGAGAGNKGREAALVAIEMADLYRRLA